MVVTVGFSVVGGRLWEGTRIVLLVGVDVSNFSGFTLKPIQSHRAIDSLEIFDKGKVEQIQV